MRKPTATSLYLKVINSKSMFKLSLMKRRILLLTISLLLLNFCLLSTKVVAQPSFSVGAGFNVANVNDPRLKYFLKPGIQVGGFVTYPINRNISFVGGLQSSIVASRWQLVYTTTNPPSTTKVNIDFRIAYLDIPVTVKFRNEKKLYFHTGVKASVKLGAHLKVTNDYFDLSELEKKGFSSPIIALRAGIGYNCTKHLAVELLSDLGLSDFQVNSQFGNYTERLNVFQATVLYKFPLNGQYKM